MRILLVSPYHGGSHQAWAEGYQRYSHHQVDLLTLPARFWKWRMHGGAITLARRFANQAEQPDLLLATDMLDLTTFLALTRDVLGQMPVALYMHENQLTYPLPQEPGAGPMRRQKGERDLHYAFINYSSMLAADIIYFNSYYHRKSFFEALSRFLKNYPEYNELATIATLEDCSHVLAVGVDLHRLDLDARVDGTFAAPLIVWNQRWEYDKNPAAFFSALYAIEAENIPFRLAICGKNFRRYPSEFAEAEERLRHRIVHFGYATEDQYRRILWEATATVSTALHEFFGISILEAIYCQTFPVLPDGLSYPELIPENVHHRCLYRTPAGMHEHLRWALIHPAEARAIATELAQIAAGYDWSNLAPQYDSLLSHAAGE